MASMNMEEHLEEHPKEDKPIIGNCQEEVGNVSNPNDSELPKSVEEDKDKESTNLPVSHRHCKLPPELNCQIFYCLKLATRRKFISGFGWDFYAMFRQILLKKSMRLRNPQENAWRSNAEMTISNGGLNAINHTNGRLNIYAEKGFPLSGTEYRKDDFPGTIFYYYEVKTLTSVRWLAVGLTDGEILHFFIQIPNRNIYDFGVAGQYHHFEFPEGVIRPKLKETENVAGCGILIDSDDELTIFFTMNGILIDRQFPIDPMVDHLVPTVALWGGMSLEVNFGDNPTKPFEYDIKKCPGMGLEWI